MTPNPAPTKPELDYSVIKHRSISGLVVLVSRTFIIQLIALAGFFFLSTFLEISEIGLFFAVSEIVAILGYFSDIGLAAALIQKHQTIKTEDIRTTFTIQQILVGSLVALVFIFSPQISGFYNLNSEQTWLLWALTAAFFLASLKTIPSVLLERQLQFDKLVIVETAEVLLFYGIAVFMSWQGYGIHSYTLAVIARGLIGTSLIYYLAPWKIGFAFSITTIKQLMKFGLPYQANTLLAMVKDRFLNLLLFKLIGAQGMGLIGWAQTWSQKPLRFISDNVNKVAFPTFSRLQGDQLSLTKAINKMLFFSSTIVFPTVIGLGLIAQPALTLIPCESGMGQIPCDQKWQAALIPLYLYLFNTAWASVSTPLTNTLAAIGKITTVSKLMVMWTILTWVIIAPLAYFYGYIGVAYGVAIVSLSSVVPIWLVYKIIKFDLLNSIIKPLISSLIMGILVWLILQIIPVTNYNLQITRIISAVSIGILSYSVLLHLITGKDLIPQVKLFIKGIKNKS